MYSIDKTTGAIKFPDGFSLLPPYEHERYLTEYAPWVQAGNSPQEVESSSLLGDEDIEVKPDQARIAMAQLDVYNEVLEFVGRDDTPLAIKIKFEFTPGFRRNDDAVIQTAVQMRWTKQFLDELFALAVTIK